METIFAVGQRVRFTAGPLGCLDAADGMRFTDAVTVNEGDGGEVVDAHKLPDGWLLVRADNNYYVPVHPAMIEAA